MAVVAGSKQDPGFVPGPLSCFSPLTKVFPTMQYMALQSWELGSPLMPLVIQSWPTNEELQHGAAAADPAIQH